MNQIEEHRRFSALLPWSLTALAALVAGFFLARVTFELWPAQVAVLATWPGAVGAAALALLNALGLRWVWLRKLQPRSLSISVIGTEEHTPSPQWGEGKLQATSALPFLLLLLYILWPRVNLLMAGVLFAGAAGLSLALFLRAVVPAERRWILRVALLATFVTVVLVAYLWTVGRTVGAADTFELQVVAPTLGVAHPTGYPLVILIGKLFSLIPIGTVAWRINLISVMSATAAIVLLYLTLFRVTGQRVISALAASCLAFSRVFWSQALEAEVYPLNATFAAAILWLLVAQHAAPPGDEPRAKPPSRRWLFTLGAVYGLSFTNHLTMVIMAPAIVLGVLFARPRVRWRDWLLAAGCFVAPLLIDLYIPLRWPALHNGQWMPFGDFIAYITGRQFGGAVQFELWRDVTRWRIVGELMLDAFGPAGAALAAGGVAWLTVRHRRLALLTLIPWVGYFAYGLIYNIPDISVFILPAHILMAVWIGLAVAQLLRWLTRRAGARLANWAVGMALVAFSMIPLSLVWTNGPRVDQSQVGWALYDWGKYVMDLPMPVGSAILADSEKIAPLYYLKRIENVRRDVDTLVLADEGLYRAELDRRAATGQPVYLARYLPGVAGPYRLHSLGPLVRVTTKPASAPPPMQKPLDNVTWGDDKVALLGLDVERGQGDVAWRATLYWQARAKLDANYHVRLRWVGPSGQVWWQDHGAHPVGGYNPTAAWEPGEVIADYHEIPADAAIPPGLLRLDVGWFLPFRDEGLNRDGTTSPWLTLVLLDQVPSPPRTPMARDLRASFDDELLITGASDPGVLPPGEPASVTFEWSRIKSGPSRTLWLRWINAKGARVSSTQVKPYAGEYPTSRWPIDYALTSRVTITAPPDAGVYTLRAGWLSANGQELVARCAWLAPASRDCEVGTLRVEGTARGQGINFDNQVLLLDAQVGRTEMHPNETLDVKLEWQGLRQWNADYTAFVHLIGPDGKLYGQVDQWPVDGTLATTDWPPGRTVDDPYHVPLVSDAPPGIYQVEVGWYLLATLRRLPVVDAEGRPIDDHVIVGTVTVQP